MNKTSVEAIERVLDVPGPTDVGQWMRDQGCPPESWVLSVPNTASRRLQSHPAVLFNPFVPRPFFIRRPAAS